MTRRNTPRVDPPEPPASLVSVAVLPQTTGELDVQVRVAGPLERRPDVVADLLRSVAQRFEGEHVRAKMHNSQRAISR